MIARDVMTPNPLTVAPEACIAEVWDLMREVDVRHVPVTLDGVLVGMLSDRDLARVDIARVLKAGGADALRQELADAAHRRLVSGAQRFVDSGYALEVVADGHSGSHPVGLIAISMAYLLAQFTHYSPARHRCAR